MTEKKRVRYYEEYVTVAVTALPPGWRVAIRCTDNSIFEQPCPALLLQELRATVQYWDDVSGAAPRRRTATYPCLEPYDTRVVPALYDLTDGRMEDPDACGGVLGLLAPGQEIPEWMEERSDA